MVDKAETTTSTLLTPRWDCIAGEWKNTSALKRVIGGSELALISLGNTFYYSAAVLPSIIYGLNNFVDTIKKALRCFAEVIYLPLGFAFNSEKTIAWHAQQFPLPVNKEESNFKTQTETLQKTLLTKETEFTNEKKKHIDEKQIFETLNSGLTKENLGLFRKIAEIQQKNLDNIQTLEDRIKELQELNNKLLKPSESKELSGKLLRPTKEFPITILNTEGQKEEFYIGLERVFGTEENPDKAILDYVIDLNNEKIKAIFKREDETIKAREYSLASSLIEK